MSTEIRLDSGEPWSEYLSPHAIPPNVPTTGEDSVVIAPWLAPDETPKPPPKQSHQRSLGFSSKRSINFVSARNGSTSGLSKTRGSETNSITDTLSSVQTERTTVSEPRRSKGMGILNALKKKASKIGKDEYQSSSTLLVPPLPTPMASPSAHSHPDPLPPPPVPKKGRRKNHSKSSAPSLPSKDPEITLDTNLDEMEGIVDLSMRYDFRGLTGDGSSPGSFENSSRNSSSLSTSERSFQPLSTANNYGHTSSQTIFRDPFSPGNSLKRKIPSQLEFRRVSPKTVIPATNGSQNHESEQHSPGWVAPESWAVEKEGEAPEVPDYTSSDDDDLGSATPPAQVKQTRRRAKTMTKRAQSPAHYQIRIHRIDGSYHVVKCPLTTTVADLIPVINRKLVLDQKRESHSLYVKERERERVLAPTERPADLVRRRLTQAGYQVSDGLQSLGADEIGFLIRFIYKSNLLGGSGDDVVLSGEEYIDLTGRSLKTIPIVLYSLANKIISLNLSRNPMLEIPLDFVQSCTTLRELRLSNMAMKKVPQSVRHSESLHRLDISCNRMADLDDAGLERIPHLSSLKAQNNRIDKLPHSFVSLRSLKYLNISNNKFQLMPSVLSEMTNLVDLDISFNDISSLPHEIGNLRALERLLIVGNKITRLPKECSGLVNLIELDCRRNNISDLSLVCNLPRLKVLLSDHNAVHALDLDVGPSLETLDASHNDVTKLTAIPSRLSAPQYNLISLNVSHAKLSRLEGAVFSHLTALRTLKLDHNSFRLIPETIGSLTELIDLSCSDNQLDALPESIGNLQKLVTLDAHNNSLQELPVSMWQCGSLKIVNVTSNLLRNWHDLPTPTNSVENVSFFNSDFAYQGFQGNELDVQRKQSTAGSINSLYGRSLPPLALSLHKLYMGENRLTEDVLHPLTALKELRVLNLSFNNIQELPSTFFRNFTQLEEIYLSGNKLSTIPTEDIHRLLHLTVMFLNGNKLQVLPHELGKLKSLTVLDVGSNLLKYNINNWEFDWNWNFNRDLKYLNLSGNKRLKIQPDHTQRMSMAHQHAQRKVLADFAGLTQLRVLGLMDVTVTGTSVIPEETDDRRVRTSLSEVNNMAYGIADTLGKRDCLGMLDVVIPEFRGRANECIFAMFGRFDAPPLNNRVSKYLCESLMKTFATQLDRLDRNSNEGVPDALRRTFLELNKNMHAFLTSTVNFSRKMSAATATSVNGVGSTAPADLGMLLRNGASGIVVYFIGKTVYVANAGDALAVISRHGTAHLVSKKHEPFDRDETVRIRLAEGWVSPRGHVNEEIDVSRSFGFYHLLPAVNPQPDIKCWELSELDEFIIIANRGLWDYVSYRTAVDIARPEKNDPMIAAQKLRDFAISYGADGSTMIMVICVADLFSDNVTRSRQATTGSIPDTEAFLVRKPKPKTQDIGDVALSRLPQEVHAPTGHIALVFTDIRNSTHLWEANAGMPTAMRLHNTLLRRQLRLLGGYEVKTEGDAFMCSFSNVLSALLWALTVQISLLHESWPLEILECEDGRELYDSRGRLIERGLSVRMGIHCGTPVCEPDPITHRMDYFGPMVNRTARINSSAAGGQIMCSADVVREIEARILRADLDAELDSSQRAVIDSIKRFGVEVKHVGETRMKGLEVPEVLSLVYPSELAGRDELRESPTERDSSGRIQFSVPQMQKLGELCARLEALASCRVLRPPPTRKGSAQAPGQDDSQEENSIIMYADVNNLIPNITEKTSDRELMAMLDALSLRIESALTTLTLRSLGDKPSLLLSNLQQGMALDESMLFQVLSALQSALPSSNIS